MGIGCIGGKVWNSTEYWRDNSANLIREIAPGTYYNHPENGFGCGGAA